MTALEFSKTLFWQEKSREITLEVIAVCLPLLIYSVSLVIGQFGFATKQAEFHHIMEVPDAFFGGCVLLAFSTIRGWSIRRRETFASTEFIEDQTHRLTIISLILLISCSGMACLATVSKGQWALLVGAMFLYAGFYLYKNIVFRVSLIDYMNANHDG